MVQVHEVREHMSKERRQKSRRGGSSGRGERRERDVESLSPHDEQGEREKKIVISSGGGVGG